MNKKAEISLALLIGCIVVMGIVASVGTYGVLRSKGFFEKPEEVEVNETVSDPVEDVIETLENITEEEVKPEGYVLDELLLTISFNGTLSDRELKNLFDDEVQFDGESYDAEEVISYTGFEVSINKKDFADNAYLTIPKGGIEYTYILESKLNVSEINDDETLEINFLGQSITISNWDVVAEEVTLSKGKEFTLGEGETIEVDGHNLVVSLIGDNSIYVFVDGSGRNINEDSTVRVNDLEIKVLGIYTKTTGLNKVVLELGEEVEVTIEDGDEYMEDSIFEYVIGSNSIGVVLIEDFSQLDDRDGFDALDVGMEVCLPNSYVCVMYEGVADEDTEEYEFFLDGGVVGIDGRFVSGINDYDEVFVNNGSIYEDDEYLDLINASVYFGDSDIELLVDNSSIYIDDITIALGLNDITVNAVNISTKEDNYLNAYGIVIESPEDSVDDKQITIQVPEKELEASVKVY